MVVDFLWTSANCYYYFNICFWNTDDL